MTFTKKPVMPLAATVDMHGEVTRTTWTGMQFHWRHVLIKVPRRRRSRNVYWGRAISLAAAGGLIAPVARWDLNSSYVPVLSSTFAAWVEMVIAGHVSWVGRIRLQNGERKPILKEGASRNHPHIQEMKSKSWEFGRKPTDAPTQTSTATLLKLLGCIGLFLLLTWIFTLGSQAGTQTQARPHVSPATPSQRLQSQSTSPSVASVNNEGVAPKSFQETYAESLRQQNREEQTASVDSFFRIRFMQESLRRVSKVDSDNMQPDQMDSNSRASYYVGENECAKIRQGQNSDVRTHNSQLARCRSLAKRHDDRVDVINEKVREYDRLVGVQ